jgi:hypothetical protein
MLGNKQIFQFVSLAKKTVTFFTISFSIFRFLIQFFNCRISSCSGDNLPFPRKACPPSFRCSIDSARIIREL